MPTASRAPDNDRRLGRERRQRAWYSLLLGSFTPRRRHGRRYTEGLVAIADLHQPRWLAVALGILLLSVTDAFLTLQLMERGANEANPIMAMAMRGSGGSFAAWKMALTSLGVVLLTLLAPLRAFQRFPVGMLLYAVLGIYVALVGYEIWLLRWIPA